MPPCQGLPTQEARLAQFMLLNIDKLALETGRTLAAKVGVSEVTVGRLLRRLGCDGMRGLKAMMREQYSLSAGARPMAGGEAPAMNDRLERVLGAEIDALHSIFQQAGSNAFRELAKRLAEAQGVYVTGFQSVRGIAEDCARRLAIARPNVRYLSAHDSMLAEWLLPSGEGGDRPEDTCLLLIDVVPLCKGISGSGADCPGPGPALRGRHRRVLPLGQRDVADAVLHAPSRSGAVPGIDRRHRLRAQSRRRRRGRPARRRRATAHRPVETHGPGRSPVLGSGLKLTPDQPRGAMRPIHPSPSSVVARGLYSAPKQPL